ncbi:unnamed protein product [Rotaria magnacalcarata]|uniref:Uncharacterized protein n=1 Tax=Rotaria magnacalcarata TaxID=392030 RepID=A0A820G6D1_9BILA|nr:unnamed protein product [Rotaria magnacalcarata]CAF4273012.1 unnamed protein product [Rotaria magnacalcarata]
MYATRTYILIIDTNLPAFSFDDLDEEHVEILLKLCDELRPNLRLTTGGTGINSDDMTAETNRKHHSCGEHHHHHHHQQQQQQRSIYIYILELTYEMFYLIISFNQPIDYLNPRPEYIRVVIIEWSIKFSIPIARTFSLDTQSSLISARRCKDLDGYSQQVD